MDCDYPLERSFFLRNLKPIAGKIYNKPQGHRNKDNATMNIHKKKFLFKFLFVRFPSSTQKCRIVLNN